MQAEEDAAALRRVWSANWFMSLEDTDDKDAQAQFSGQISTDKRASTSNPKKQQAKNLKQKTETPSPLKVNASADSDSVKTDDKKEPSAKQVQKYKQLKKNIKQLKAARTKVTGHYEELAQKDPQSEDAVKAKQAIAVLTKKIRHLSSKYRAYHRKWSPAPTPVSKKVRKTQQETIHELTEAQKKADEEEDNTDTSLTEAILARKENIEEKIGEPDAQTQTVHDGDDENKKGDADAAATAPADDEATATATTSAESKVASGDPAETAEATTDNETAQVVVAPSDTDTAVSPNLQGVASVKEMVTDSDSSQNNESEADSEVEVDAITMDEALKHAEVDDGSKQDDLILSPTTGACSLQTSKLELHLMVALFL